MSDNSSEDDEGYDGAPRWKYPRIDPVVRKSLQIGRERRETMSDTSEDDEGYDGPQSGNTPG